MLFFSCSVIFWRSSWDRQTRFFVASSESSIRKKERNMEVVANCTLGSPGMSQIFLLGHKMQNTWTDGTRNKYIFCKILQLGESWSDGTCRNFLYRQVMHPLIHCTLVCSQCRFLTPSDMAAAFLSGRLGWYFDVWFLTLFKSVTNLRVLNLFFRLLNKGQWTTEKVIIALPLVRMPRCKQEVNWLYPFNSSLDLIDATLALKLIITSAKISCWSIEYVKYCTCSVQISTLEQLMQYLLRKTYAKFSVTCSYQGVGVPV